MPSTISTPSIAARRAAMRRLLELLPNAAIEDLANVCTFLAMSPDDRDLVRGLVASIKAVPVGGSAGSHQSRLAVRPR